MTKITHYNSDLEDGDKYQFCFSQTKLVTLNKSLALVLTTSILLLVNSYHRTLGLIIVVN